MPKCVVVVTANLLCRSPPGSVQLACVTADRRGAGQPYALAPGDGCLILATAHTLSTGGQPWPWPCDYLLPSRESLELRHWIRPSGRHELWRQVGGSVLMLARRYGRGTASLLGVGCGRGEACCEVDAGVGGVRVLVECAN